MILPCTCYHTYQDQTYGPGRRVHNIAAKGARCTVCGNIKTTTKEIATAAKEEKK